MIFLGKRVPIDPSRIRKPHCATTILVSWQDGFQSRHYRLSARIHASCHLAADDYFRLMTLRNLGVDFDEQIPIVTLIVRGANATFHLQVFVASVYMTQNMELKT